MFRLLVKLLKSLTVRLIQFFIELSFVIAAKLKEKQQCVLAAKLLKSLTTRLIQLFTELSRSSPVRLKAKHP